MWRWKQLMINFFHPLKFRNASENCKIVALEPKNHKKWARKLENQNCEKWSREGQDKSVTSLRTYYNASEHKSVDILPPSALPVAVKLCQSAAFQMKSEDEVKMGKNELKTLESKLEEMIAGRSKQVWFVFWKSVGTLVDHVAYFSSPSRDHFLCCSFNFRVFGHNFVHFDFIFRFQLNAADWHNFTATDSADDGNISPDSCVFHKCYALLISKLCL